MKITTIATEEDLQAAFDIRKKVFVEEQHVPLEDEFDEFDTLTAPCKHILVAADNQIAGTGRIRWVDGVGKLERICILPEFRSLGLGKEIVLALEKIAQEEKTASVKLHGQTHAEKFYQKLGYETASPVFMEDGIPHLIMTKTL